MRKILKKLKKFRKNFIDNFESFVKKDLEVLENFNKMYTIIYAFHCFFLRKTLYINCVHNRIFPKFWGGQMHYCPPPGVKSGGGACPPCSPPCGGPHELYVTVEIEVQVAIWNEFIYINTLNSVSLHLSLISHFFKDFFNWQICG